VLSVGESSGRPAVEAEVFEEAPESRSTTAATTTANTGRVERRVIGSEAKRDG
jgi:hypothetical protein